MCFAYVGMNQLEPSQSQASIVRLARHRAFRMTFVLFGIDTRRSPQVSSNWVGFVKNSHKQNEIKHWTRFFKFSITFPAPPFAASPYSPKGERVSATRNRLWMLDQTIQLPDSWTIRWCSFYLSANGQGKTGATMISYHFPLPIAVPSFFDVRVRVWVYLRGAIIVLQWKLSLRLWKYVYPGSCCYYC